MSQSTFFPTALPNLIEDHTSATSGDRQAVRPLADLRRNAPGKLPQRLQRGQSYPCSLFSTALLTPVYVLSKTLGDSKPPSQAVPAPNRLHQVNWALHSSRLQSRIGGWKESNMLYRGSLTYHS
ncbi:hypothetical protein ACQKDS_12350 [Serratia sp. NPDC078593]|uniref:hypothetical protein n=1 Tax=unclassified Serratia (in: enterobacteria) TaxID=2647522 RepID=UPI0037CE37D1